MGGGATAMFTIERWRADMRAVIGGIAADPEQAQWRAGTCSPYPLVVGSAMLPIVPAYAEAPSGVMMALVSLAGGFGANLIANLMQGKYSLGDPLAIAAAEAQSLELAGAYRKLADGLLLFPLAERALLEAGHAGLAAQLRTEFFPSDPYAAEQLKAHVLGAAG